MDELLCELIAELGVTDEQFMQACSKASENPIHKKIVDQLSAVDDFVAFKKLMVKKNIELQNQAIQMEQEMQQQRE